MLLVHTYAGPSLVEGVGVFAAEPIAKGALIWRFEPTFDRLAPAELMETGEPAVQEFLRKYAYPAAHAPGMLIVELDNGRLMNHSDEPNTDFSSPLGGYALRDIAAGEELLCNYGEFAPEFELLPSLAAAHSIGDVRPNGAAAE
ncbi:MAG: SET domain-containing protein-lysine N-methyltransferase [Alphaproteobacteria bacterium]|nr:SET domain-containing protein-lysine N-methyltransferase [Alphaproteobacteria bacterium]